MKQTWEFEDQWVHYTEFIERKDLHHTFLYNYCVRWSVPTARRPIPHIFAGVDFTIKFSKGKPPDAPVEVFYIFEDHKLVHRPGTYRFREQWLRDIIECKHSLLASIPV
ncbi:A-kinase anchor protein 14 [Loxodonta africana]|uniref:A-kinase anchor protein 14 n=1 Tax=Loxodonta africana TaxID=9785 RepID=UPI0005406C51|nr:A-kinase anchor protein 14 [Loxodonta africana]